MDDLQKRSWAEISLENIRHNYNAIRASLPEGCRFLGVVKADAYGHGAVQVSHLLQDCGADYLAVSCLDEALELRRGGITMMWQATESESGSMWKSNCGKVSLTNAAHSSASSGLPE